MRGELVAMGRGLYMRKKEVRKEHGRDLVSKRLIRSFALLRVREVIRRYPIHKKPLLPSAGHKSRIQAAIEKFQMANTETQDVMLSPPNNLTKIYF